MATAFPLMLLRIVLATLYIYARYLQEVVRLCLLVTVVRIYRYIAALLTDLHFPVK